MKPPAIPRLFSAACGPRLLRDFAERPIFSVGVAGSGVPSHDGHPETWRPRGRKHRRRGGGVGWTPGRRSEHPRPKEKRLGWIFARGAKEKEDIGGTLRNSWLPWVLLLIRMLGSCLMPSCFDQWRPAWHRKPCGLLYRCFPIPLKACLNMLLMVELWRNLKRSFHSVIGFPEFMGTSGFPMKATQQGKTVSREKQPNNMYPTTHPRHALLSGVKAWWLGPSGASKTIKSFRGWEDWSMEAGMNRWVVLSWHPLFWWQFGGVLKETKSKN